MRITITLQGAFVRSTLLSIINGGITLTILLIAPLGLAAVIANTVLITVCTFMVNSFSEIVVQWALKAQSSNATLSEPNSNTQLPGLPAGDRNRLKDRQ